MNSDNSDPRSSRLRPGRLRRLLGKLGWIAVGAVATVLLVADPFRLHPADTWIQRVLGLSPAGASTSAPGAVRSETVALGKQLWTCGMHPEVILEQPGLCPICSMELVPLRDGAETGDSRPRTRGAASPSGSWICQNYPEIVLDAPGECPVDGTPLVPAPVSMPAVETKSTAGRTTGREVLFYRNPMDPTITSPVPMQDSMGMDYVPVYSDEVSATASQGATVTIDPTVVQNMNVLTQRVERRDVERQIRTVGYLDYDQQKMVSVTTKYTGFVEKVYVNYIGEPVRRGQPLFEIYSPELVQTQEELLAALSFARRLEGTTEEAYRRSEALVAAARRRLGFWDISQEQIERLEATGLAERTLTVTAPSSGVVMKRLEGLEGKAVHPGMEVFHIADLSSLWLSVEVFEDQLPWLAERSTAEINLSYFPGETFTGRVRFVEPAVTEKTRTVGLRLEVPNRDGRLRAGMYATVIFKPAVARGVIAVPAMAVLRTGERDLVVVDLGKGKFVPREVRLGAEGNHDVEVLAGLTPGERIVTSAQFLIDSESNLREAVQKLIAARSGGQGGADAQ